MFFLVFIPIVVGDGISYFASLLRVVVDLFFLWVVVCGRGHNELRYEKYDKSKQVQIKIVVILYDLVYFNLFSLYKK